MEERGRPERRLWEALASEDGLGREMSVLAYPACRGRWGRVQRVRLFSVSQS